MSKRPADAISTVAAVEDQHREQQNDSTSSSTTTTTTTAAAKTTTTTTTTTTTDVLIVGAGFGGLSTALCLGSKKDDQDNHMRVLLLDASDKFTIGGLWQFVWTDRLLLNQITFHLNDAQLPDNVELRTNATVTAWDTTQKQVTLQDGSVVAYTDSIVIACGVVPVPEDMPGMKESCINICSFGTVERQRLEAQTFLERASSASAGTTKATFCLAIGQCPYKCPVAPFELTCLLEERARNMGVRDHCRFVISCPVDWPMPASTKKTFLKVLKERHIEFLGEHAIERMVVAAADDEEQDDNQHSIEATSSSGNKVMIHYSNGNELKADLVWGIHPLKAPEFVRNALPNDMFVNGSVDIQDLSHRVLPHTYVIGDCSRVAAPTDASLIVPKAGEFAWKMGRTVADEILKKRDEEKYHDRTGRCIAELGEQQGITVENDFSAVLSGAGSHHVKVELTDCSQKLKIDWVNSYLSQIFGDAKTFSLDDLQSSRCAGVAP